jgi:hypothetical protein
MLGLDVQSRQNVMREEHGRDGLGLASDAAACAIRFGKVEDAIVFLETGRSVFWSQALQLRTPLDGLRIVDPDLAAKVSTLLGKLERGSHRDLSLARALGPDAQENIMIALPTA